MEVQVAIAGRNGAAMATDRVVTGACERLDKAALRPFYFRLVRFKQCS